MTDKEREFVEMFMQVFKNNGEVRQRVLEWVCSCPNIKTET